MSSDAHDPTIAAIATSPGAGGIGVIRISGADSRDILTKLFRPKNTNALQTSHKMYYGWIFDPATHTPVDEVLAVYMQAPHTYTREDVVEIHCHGSYLAVQSILALILSSGATLAQPGEFTKRAFLNGRIDLTQAEAVLELLQSKTKKSLGMAVSQLKGDLYGRVSDIRDSLISVRAIIEVAIDFPEDEVDILDTADLSGRIRDNVQTPLAELISSSDKGKIFRDGISVVILGRPNVGKSSLLNALLKEERAIVTAIPGTTRDIIEEYLDIKGMPVRIIDTAGIRESDETVEEMGIKKARQKMADADLVLLLFDATQPLKDEDFTLYQSVQEKNHILVINKSDLAPDFDTEKFTNTFPGQTSVLLSARTHAGLDSLEDAIFNTVTGDTHMLEAEHSCVPNVRHRDSLSRTLTSTGIVLEGLTKALSPDLIAIDLQAALDHLGDIIGQTTTEDVLDKIFEEFCLGK